TASCQRTPALDEHAPAVVELAERVGHGLAVVLADEHAVLAPGDVALERLIAVEDVADEAGAAVRVHDLVLEADQPPRRNPVLEPHAAHAVGLHVEQLALA